MPLVLSQDMLHIAVLTVKIIQFINSVEQEYVFFVCAFIKDTFRWWKESRLVLFGTYTLQGGFLQMCLVSDPISFFFFPPLFQIQTKWPSAAAVIVNQNEPNLDWTISFYMSERRRDHFFNCLLLICSLKRKINSGSVKLPSWHNSGIFLWLHPILVTVKSQEHL